MNNKSKIAVVAIIILVVATLAISFSTKKQDSPLKIGYFGPFTGLLANSTGESVAEGFKLAESQRNASGDIKVEVVYEDDSCDPKKAISAAQKLLEVDKVNILVSGVCSGSTLAVAPIAEQHHVILISPTSASPKITSAGDYVFRLSSPTTGMAKAAIDFLESKGYTKVAILYENNEYPAGWKDSFVSQFKGEVAIEGIAPGSTDVKSQLLKLSTTKPQAYVFTTISPSSANAALKQARELKLNAPIIGNDTFSLKSVHQQPEADGIYAVTYSYDVNSPQMVTLLSSYKEKYNRTAKEEIYTALGYDTFNALYDSIESCKSMESDCIKEKLYARDNIEGVSGTYSIDQNGDTQRSFVVRRVSGGKLEMAK